MSETLQVRVYSSNISDSRGSCLDYCTSRSAVAPLHVDPSFRLLPRVQAGFRLQIGPCVVPAYFAPSRLVQHYVCIYVSRMPNSIIISSIHLDRSPPWHVRNFKGFSCSISL
jgi:hypothetical protein